MNNSILLSAPNYVAACDVKDWQRAVFLAGSITNAENWQDRAAKELFPAFNVFNPRRENFDLADKSQERVQIAWERHYLGACGIILFYFSHETLAPITLLELGKMLVTCKYAPWKKLYVCIHPEYKRMNDVIIQTELENIEFAKKIRFNLEESLELIVKENA